MLTGETVWGEKPETVRKLDALIGELEPAEQEHSLGYDVWLVVFLPENDIGIDDAGTGYIIDAKTGEFIRRPY